LSVINLRFELFLAANFLFQRASLLQQRLRVLRTIPEIRRMGERVNSLQFLAACSNIKETSRVVPLVGGDLRRRFSNLELICCRSFLPQITEPGAVATALKHSL
jgi:hypothetical protein